MLGTQNKYSRDSSSRVAGMWKRREREREQGKVGAHELGGLGRVEGDGEEQRRGRAYYGDSGD